MKPETNRALVMNEYSSMIHSLQAVSCPIEAPMMEINYIAGKETDLKLHINKNKPELVYCLKTYRCGLQHIQNQGR